MKDVINNINNASTWLIRNQNLLINYMINIIEAIIIIIIGIITSRTVSIFLNRVMFTHHIDATITDFLSALVRYGISIITIIAALGCIGVQTTSVITMLGAAGLAVGLALQGSLANLAAGVLLVTLRPFRTGEYVDLNGTAGTVLNVQIFSTTLRSIDGRIVIVPNNKVINSNIINFSREPIRRNELIIGVGYNSDIKLVKKLLIDIIASDDRILKDREIIVRINELSISSINFVVRVWSKSCDLQNVYWDLLERIKIDFDANSISFPYSQMNVNLKYKKSELLSLM